MTYKLVFHWDWQTSDVTPIDVKCPHCGQETTAYYSTPPDGYHAPDVSWVCGCGKWSCSISATEFGGVTVSE